MPPKKPAASVKTRTVPSRGKTDTKKMKRDAKAENDDVNDDDDVEEETPEPEVESESEAESDVDEESDLEIKASKAKSKDKGRSNGDTKKRKTPPTSTSTSTLTSKPAAKAAKQSKSSSASKTKSSSASKPSTSPSTKQLLNFLLSKESLPYCFPPDELDFATQSPKARSYSLTSPSEFTPFEHLLCAALLSKPLSHVLGMRSIRTLLNEPYGFRTPESVVKAGEKKVWEALEDARTQHRQKTASYIFGMGEAFVDDGKNGKGKREMWFELSEVANEDGAGGVVEWVKKNVHGMGETGGEVFCRRIQCVDGWGDAVWPFIDSKALDALKEIGLEVQDGDALQNLIEERVDWGLVGDMGLNERDIAKGELAGEDQELLVQSEFVVCVERALGCVLQGKVEELRKEAAEL